MFSANQKDNMSSAKRGSEPSSASSPNTAGLKGTPQSLKESSPGLPKKTPINLKNPKAAQAKEYVTELSFVENFTKIFMGDLDTKMRFTFNM